MLTLFRFLLPQVNKTREEAICPKTSANKTLKLNVKHGQQEALSEALVFFALMIKFKHGFIQARIFLIRSRLEHAQ